ncbi:esterase/lipase family protein [Anaeromyxobacter oryzae]|uniref:Permease n=1 Tax=Anaeromyxobacter oryzae TaxID=2918170 RepID=A0ABN6MYF8_9BACT|nr:GPI inositol-deacylase [Anaeromyxobacter oryzae]BDG05641.1 permease [Anaeromyxobacter oryzae]
MTKKTRNPLDDLRGATRLAIEATRSVVDLVEAMHHNIGAGPAILGRPLMGPTRLLTGPIYRSVRGVTRMVGAGIDRALGQLAPLVAPLLGESVPGIEREAVLAALNGVLGDYLAESGNPLAIEMRLRHDGHPLELEERALRAAFPHAGGKLLVLVHGSCLGDRQWSRLGHDHGGALARDLGFTPVYLHYNSGLHISTNGRALAAMLERLVAEWPAPLDELVILAHSMGGLVARSACHFGEAAGHGWRRKLRKLVCLGSPHHGAPLERGGHWVDVLLGVSRYSAPLARLGKIRSAGVTDMRFGNVLDEHWQGRDRFARAHDHRRQLKLPDGVRCYAIAATRASEAGGKLPGDGLVPVDSALGRHAKPELTLEIPDANQWIAHGMGHLDLLSRAEVYEKIRSWLSS